MNFKDWIFNEVGWLQQQLPTNRDYLGKIARAGIKTAVGAVPFVGSMVDIGEAALEIFRMRAQGKDVRKMIAQMMNAKDKAPGMPNNIFDIDDRISSILSDPAKMQIANQIISKLDVWIKQVQNKEMPQETANTLAINYIKSIIGQS